MYCSYVEKLRQILDQESQSLSTDNCNFVAGLMGSETGCRSIVAELDRLAVFLARQKPAWEPGTRQAYHARSVGFSVGELLRRVDPQHRSLGEFFEEGIATPLGLEVYVRLPETIPNSRLAIIIITPPRRLEMLFGFPLLEINPGTAVYFDEERIYARNLAGRVENHCAGAGAFDAALNRFA